ncbi:Phosphopentomutase [Syntrophobotulus glycolicus DSM 8271]|uniref:Phosphopentomutase n=1 Tax=Syntrophobotulus glycolicus (strain DSM 8271 / FlGlyR) TaxID=645991 RepID=F0T080_SYNGF|nr:phosphopentomutase [Syntrophobotulus glycolicus]ADY56167.1 Phosphopentomutase [Syntrophobotulus glycolicus DSM 8271]
MTRRAILIVLDSVGIGAMPDAGDYGDEGSNTLGNIARAMGGLNIPNLLRLGLGNIAELPFTQAAENPLGCYGKMAEKSKGKDTTTGHWEMTGIISERAFPVFPQGFPEPFIQEFEKKIGRKVLGNEVASGTEIIQRLGKEHVRTGRPIVYTSADSVFQIAAHEEVISLAELMHICQTAREMLVGEMQVSRVIARPFLGTEDDYYRTSNRHDFSIKPTGKTLLDQIKENGMSVLAVGKINDIFAGCGITEHVSTIGNMDGVEKTLAYMKKDFKGLIMTNLVDFDMLYGHRNNVQSYADALANFDQRIPEILETMKEEDLLLITADHGCDPTTISTDHSREYVPLLVFGKRIKNGVDLGLRASFADIGATISEYLEIAPPQAGKSFMDSIRDDKEAR